MGVTVARWAESGRSVGGSDSVTVSSPWDGVSLSLLPARSARQHG